MYNVSKIIIFSVVAGFTAGCTSSLEDNKLPDVGDFRPGIMVGYLEETALPDSLILIPSVPKADSATMARDEAASKESLALRGTKRWTLAVKDAQLDFPEAADTFSCVMGIPINEQETPQIYRLLRRTQTDARLSTYHAKNTYHRVRPFVGNGQPICTPDKEEFLRNNGSYPSGHSALGWASALTLAEIDPDNTTQILARGRAFSESRVVCNVHWYSDIMWGRFMGAGTVARLHANPDYRKAVEAAKAELKSVRHKGLSPTNDCRFEEEALLIKLD